MRESSPALIDILSSYIYLDWKIFVKYGGRAFLDLRWIYICSICPPPFPINFVQAFFCLDKNGKLLRHSFADSLHCCWKFWPPKNCGETLKRIWIQNIKNFFVTKLPFGWMVETLMAVGTLSACLLLWQLFVKLAQWENNKNALRGKLSYICQNMTTFHQLCYSGKVGVPVDDPTEPMNRPGIKHFIHWVISVILPLFCQKFYFWPSLREKGTLWCFMHWVQGQGTHTLKPEMCKISFNHPWEEEKIQS